MRESKPEFKELKAQAGSKVAIIVANWNSNYNNEMFDSAKETLLNSGLKEDDVVRFNVPGAFEIPVLALKIAKTGNYSAIICFATVIKGGTIHFELVANDSSRGIMDVALQTGVPVLNGILACNNTEQAEHRASRSREDKGKEIALSALEIVNTLSEVA